MNEEQFRAKRLEALAGILNGQIVQYCHGRACDRNMIDGVRELIARMRHDAKHREGLAFPEMHVIAFPRFGAIEIVRQDLDQRSVQTWMVNLTVKYPQITPAEIAAAVAQAFPHYHVDPELRRPNRRRH